VLVSAGATVAVIAADVVCAELDEVKLDGAAFNGVVAGAASPPPPPPQAVINAIKLIEHAIFILIIKLQGEINTELVRMITVFR
jgi:hypothetical protein